MNVHQCSDVIFPSQWEGMDAIIQEGEEQAQWLLPFDTMMLRK